MKQSSQMLALCACTRIRTVARLITRAYDEALRPTGLKASQLAVLAAVDSLEAPSIAALSKALFMDRSTLTRNLRPLMNAGLVVLEEDGRAKTTRLSARGQRSLEAAVPLWTRAQKEYAQRLRKQDLQEIDSQLHALISSY